MILKCTSQEEKASIAFDQSMTSPAKVSAVPLSWPQRTMLSVRKQRVRGYTHDSTLHLQLDLSLDAVRRVHL